MSGHLIRLWNVGGKLDGYLVSYAGLMGDPPTGRLKDLSFDPTDHSLTFSTEISPGLKMGPSYELVRAFQQIKFQGKLTRRYIKGKLQVMDFDCQTRCIETRRLFLLRSKELTDMTPEFESVAD